MRLMRSVEITSLPTARRRHPGPLLRITHDGPLPADASPAEASPADDRAERITVVVRVTSEQHKTVTGNLRAELDNYFT
jgi:hypothetical protein